MPAFTFLDGPGPSPLAAPDARLSKHYIPRVSQQLQQNDPAETAQEAVHQVMLKEDAPPSAWRVRALRNGRPGGVATPSTDREPLIGEWTRPSPPSIAPRADWARSIEAALHRWDKLSHEELAQTLGREPSLVARVRVRYEIGHAEAAGQVREFLAALPVVAPR